MPGLDYALKCHQMGISKGVAQRRHRFIFLVKITQPLLEKTATTVA